MAYKNRDYTTYGNVNVDLYDGQKHPSSMSMQPSFFNRPFPIDMVDERGSRHFHYRPISEVTYRIVTDFFRQTRRRFSNDESKEYWEKFRDFFSKEHMDQQFKFKDAQGEAHGMYNWADPGYSRLSKIEHAVRTIEKYYIPPAVRDVQLKLIN